MVLPTDGSAPAWNAELHFFEDYEIGDQIASQKRTITEGEAAQFNLLVNDLHPYHVDDHFATHEGLFGRRVVAGAMTFAIGMGLVATNNKNAFSYGYDRLRFIRPVFIGDTLFTIRTVKDKSRQKNRLGHVRMSYEVYKYGDPDPELVLYCEHIWSVRVRDGASTDG